jgi:hypothetical protein
MRVSFKRAAVSTFLVAASLLGGARSARACGGFFCSQAQPVNQSAERIIFAANDDGTVTAVIQILYQGPSQNFSWLLPISTVPKDNQIGVASDIAFQQLQRATNPNYVLTTRLEGNCAGGIGIGIGTSSSTGTNTGTGDPSGGEDDGVTVEASGVVGPFEWTVIGLDASLADPAAAAVMWLTEKGYDVTPGASQLLGPYLADGMYLLALRLTKESDTGSIRPIVLTYEAAQPMIPIKLTAVAANDDMGVMAWVLANARAVPANYRSLELNEARINWFNAASNYDDVVTAAADDAGGQGFVTEFAGTTAALGQVVWGDSAEQQWQGFKTTTYASFLDLFDNSRFLYGEFDGFWDAARKVISLPAGVAFADFQLCPGCYPGASFSPSAWISALETDVIEPVRAIQELLDAHPYVTRLYSTLSAAEMTADPLFTFNAGLSNVNNQHLAERVIECNPDVTQAEATWRVELPQGGVIRGTGAEAQARTWPADTSNLPPNLRITQMSATGPGVVLEDNSKPIQMLLDEHNAKVSTTGRPASGGSGGKGSGGASSAAGAAGSVSGGSKSSDSGCALSTRRSAQPAWAWLALAALALLSRRKRFSSSLRGARSRLNPALRTRPRRLRSNRLR